MGQLSVGRLQIAADDQIGRLVGAAGEAGSDAVAGDLGVATRGQATLDVRARALEILEDETL